MTIFLKEKQPHTHYIVFPCFYSVWGGHTIPANQLAKSTLDITVRMRIMDDDKEEMGRRQQQRWCWRRNSKSLGSPKQEASFACRNLVGLSLIYTKDFYSTQAA